MTTTTFVWKNSREDTLFGVLSEERVALLLLRETKDSRAMVCVLWKRSPSDGPSSTKGTVL